MFAARYSFYQHLCDRHFKDALAQQIPLNPPYNCPGGGCNYIARDSRQSLVRHFGMTHKVVIELLKRHAPEYNLGDHAIPAHEDNMIQDPFQQQQQQQIYQVQQPSQEQQQFFQPQNHLPVQHYQQPHQQQPQQMVLTENSLNQQPNMGFQGYHIDQQQPSLQNSLQQPQQLPSNHYMTPQVAVPTSGGEMRFEPQIDGTFDPSHYNNDAASADPSKKPKHTPASASAQNVVALKSSGGQDSLLVTLAVPESSLVVQPNGNQGLSTESFAAAVNAVMGQPENAALKLSTANNNTPSTLQQPKPSETPKSVSISATTPQRGGPKICEICDKQFDGRTGRCLKYNTWRITLSKSCLPT